MNMLAVLIMLKIVLFIHITNIENNVFIIFLFSTLISIFILSLLELLNKKQKKSLQLAFYITFSVVMFIDIMYYSYFQLLPSLSMVGQAKQLSAVGDSIRDLLTLKNILIIGDIPITIYYIIKSKNLKYYFNKRTMKWIPLTTGTSIILMVIVMLQTNKITILTHQEIYSFHTMDIVKTYIDKETRAEDIDISELIDINHTLETDRKNNLEELKFHGVGRGKNLIVIQVEALQNFVINLNYNNQEVTPNLNRLIEEKSSLYFDNYFQLIGRGNTSDAEFVTQNSLYPSMEDFTYNRYANNTFYGLPWLLRDYGYTTWVSHGYEKDFWNRANAYPYQGFQRFISQEDFNYQETIGFGISDAEFYDQSLDYLKELDGLDNNPFYAFLITLSSHTPYNMASKYHVLDIEGAHKGNIVANYLQAIHYADKELGRFIDNLKKEGLYENTVIAVYGDHFGVHYANKEVFPPMKDILGEEYDFDHIMNIPLIIHVPGEEINTTISKIGSQLDFYPTILNIMGYENKKGYMMGRDIINSNEYGFVAPQTVMRKGSFIDEDVIFDISGDVIFENSTVRDIRTKEMLDVNDYRDTYERIVADINKSDTILKNNLLKDIIESNGNIENIDLNNNIFKISLEEEIELVKEYNIKRLNELYDQGKKIIRLEVDKSTLNEEGMEEWLKNHKDVYLILKSKDGIGIIETMKTKDPEIRDRYIVEISTFYDQFQARRGKYRNRILNITERYYSHEEIIDFLTMHSTFAIIIDETRVNKELIDDIKKLGVKVYYEKEDVLLLR